MLNDRLFFKGKYRPVLLLEAIYDEHENIYVLTKNGAEMVNLILDDFIVVGFLDEEGHPDDKYMSVDEVFVREEIMNK